ncbi:MAG TPA: hypothetical protein VGD55_09250 [Acidothermaceae bacterium]
MTAGTAPALPLRAASWWYVGQMAAGLVGPVAVGDALADAVVGVAAALDVAAAGDDAGALEASALDVPVLDAAAVDTAAADAAVLEADDFGWLDVHAASASMPPTRTAISRRCPMPTSLPAFRPLTYPGCPGL